MKNTFLKNARIYFREYCNHTSFHGFQYLGEKGRTIFERIWWFIVFSICLGVCITSIYFVYQKWEQSPVIVNFANRGTPIYEIPFPAVTVCPESKSATDKFNFTKIMQKKEDEVPLTLLEETQFEYMSLICNYYPELNYTNNETFSEDFFEFLDEVKPIFRLENCSFLNVDQDCGWVFTPIITEVGICYTFNMLDRSYIYKEDVVHFKNNLTVGPKSKWTLQHGYDKDAGLDPYPLRAYLAGVKNGLQFNIETPRQDLDYACGDSLQGYRVMVHTPMTIPRPSQTYFKIPLDQAVVGGIEPVMITTSDRIKSYNPQSRKCYFAEERKLRYFKVYSSSNCKLECLTNYTLWFCDCVNFFMPRENETQICGTNNIECMEIAEKAMYLVNLGSKLEDSELFLDHCGCLPVCADLTYKVELSQSNWEWNKLLHARRQLPRVGNRSHLSSLTLFFKSDNFISSERNELYGPMDFLANFGGILGLFTGFSVLSLMEILYFLSVRIICNLRLYGQWAGTDN
ncbi:pickpocket protein 28-like [Tenebrio molitor]|uniref:pickpocket protein 28-like n=1 Tax=Tenebrio molitor TaxID=7067 RepID=UPI0036248F43